MLEGITAQGWFWGIFGAAAWLIFYSRFFFQWLASEFKKRSVVPVAFWYQSCIGSFMLLIWAWYTQSPLGALSQSFNLIPYSRNLIHIWRGQGTLSRTRYILTHLVVLLVVIAACVVVVTTWYREYDLRQAGPVAEARQAWFWLAVGVVGQFLFGLRFLIQWIATERRGESVVPVIFWYMGIVACILQFLTFAIRGGGEWLYAAGSIVTAFFFVRNIWLIKRTGNDAPGEDTAGSSQ